MTEHSVVSEPEDVTGDEALSLREQVIRMAFGIPPAHFGPEPLRCPICKRPWQGMASPVPDSMSSVCCGAETFDLLRAAPLVEATR